MIHFAVVPACLARKTVRARNYSTPCVEMSFVRELASVRNSRPNLRQAAQSVVDVETRSLSAKKVCAWQAVGHFPFLSFRRFETMPGSLNEREVAKVTPRQIATCHLVPQRAVTQAASALVTKLTALVLGLVLEFASMQEPYPVHLTLDADLSLP